jgi:hypothetical protein
MPARALPAHATGLDLRRIARQGPMAGDRNAHVDLRLTLPPAAQKIATGKVMDLCGVYYPHRIRVSAPPRYPVIVIVEGEQTPIWLRHIERSLGVHRRERNGPPASGADAPRGGNARNRAC